MHVGILNTVRREASAGRRFEFLLRRCLFAELLGAGLVPLINLSVGLEGERLLRKARGEGLASVWVLERPVLDGELHEGDVLLGPQ
jgi:hypothetical protein